MLGVLGLVLVGGIGATLAFGRGAPIGYFTSAAGYDEYLEAYDEALALGPAPDETIDVSTDYGMVRMLRYDATVADSAAPDPQPLVLLPGTMSGAPMWIDNVPSLSAERPVYIVDLLAQPGRSIQVKPVETAADDARWLAQALESIPGRPSVLGHSLGGWMAMNLAIHEPQAAASVILVDPVMTFGDLSLEMIARSIPASVKWTPRSWREHFASWTANDAPVDDEPVAEMIEAGMQHYSLGAPAPTRFSVNQLESMRTRTLVIVAGASRMHDSEAVATTAESALPEVTVHTYADASHAIIGEEPDRIAADVDEFLDSRQD